MTSHLGTEGDETCWKASTRASPTPSQAGSTSRFCVQAKIQGMARRLSTPPDACQVEESPHSTNAVV